MGIWKPLMEERLWQLEKGVLFRVRERYFEKEAGCREERGFFGWRFSAGREKGRRAKGFRGERGGFRWFFFLGDSWQRRATGGVLTERLSWGKASYTESFLRESLQAEEEKVALWSH